MINKSRTEVEELYNVEYQPGFRPFDELSKEWANLVISGMEENTLGGWLKYIHKYAGAKGMNVVSYIYEISYSS